MYLRKALAGSGAGFEWPTDGAVIEVPDHLAHELLAIRDAGFTEIRPDQLDEPDAALGLGGAGGDLAGMLRGLVLRAAGEARAELERHIQEQVAVLASDMREAIAHATALVREEANALRAELLRAAGAGGIKTLTAEGSAAPAVVSPPGASDDDAEASAAAGADAPGGSSPDDAGPAGKTAGGRAGGGRR